MIGAEFLSGFGMACFAACSIFFFKFYRMSRDRFYLLFCMAFLLLATERAVLLLVPKVVVVSDTPVTEGRSWVYLMRLAAFVMILAAIIYKNRSRSDQGIT
jgi:hypothetical protein